MADDDWPLIQAHFEALCDLEPGAREEALARLDLPQPLRQQLSELLAFDRQADLDAWAAEVEQFARQLDKTQWSGRRVGPYRLVRPLGEGGMGEVFLGERADGRFEAQVAIKFLAIRGERGRRQFARERRILARLNHPAIARLLDAGEDPQLGAWMVMEYVDGEPVHRRVARCQVAVRERVRWIAQAARAVGVAHQNLVLHRDLKPDHLIIDGEGRLKVLDFGVATLLEGQSGQAERTDSASFTPRYAAPEQILSQATTTATDVYALGLVLHELLADGRSAFGDEPSEQAEAKLTAPSEPLPRLPDLSDAQQRDLQAVIHSCLARRLEDRYPGPAALAADLDAWLEDRPVSVRAPSWREQARRWHKRYRLASAAMMTAIAAILIGSSLTLWFAHSAHLERNLALEEAAKARAVTTFLESIFASSTPGLEQGPETTARALLDRGQARIDEELAGQAEVAAYLALTIARSYLYLGLYDSALELLRDPRPGESMSTRHGRIVLEARLSHLKGRFSEGQAQLEALLEEDLSIDHRAEALALLSTAHINLGEIDAAEAAARKIIALARADRTVSDWGAVAHSLLGAIAYNRGDFAAAGEAFSDLYKLHVEKDGGVSDAAGLALSNLATIAFVQGELAAAVDYAQRSATTLRAHFGVDNRAVGMSLRTLGMSYRHLGRVADADHFLDRSISVLGEWGGRDLPIWRAALLQRVELKLIIGELIEAEQLILQLMPLTGIDWQADEQLVACRFERLARALALPGIESDYCAIELSEPPQSQAVNQYLIAREQWQRADPAAARSRARAEALIAELTPPDPLLAAALARLEPLP